jgi:cyclophilin family peptidyl-prolyl cis-trans isomerase
MQAMLFRNFFNFLFSGLIIPFRFCRRSFYLFSFVFSLSGASLLLTLPRLFFFSIIGTRTCVRKKDLRLPRLRLKYSPVPSPLFYPSFLHFSALTLDFISYICPINKKQLMTSNKILLICLAFIALTACNAGSKRQTNHHMENEKRTLVKLETTMGNITVALYNETPKHRDNFIKLVKEGVYDSTLFHRVIKQFMIQAGDPDSKNASDTAMLGSGDVGYTIPAEFNPKFFHKKGVLAAARQGDDVNPEKASSGCQFYIVTGRKFTEPQLLGMENKINEQREETLFDSLARRHMKEIYKMRKAGDNAGLLELQDTLEAQARELADKEEKFRFTPEQIKAYSTVGGAPHLDGSYTVFGEVTEGMEVVENIEIAKTNRADRPVENIRILKASIQ